MSDYKMIYRDYEALVSDELINSSDDEINAVFINAEAGMKIYTAGYNIVKQKGLDGKWVAVTVDSNSDEGGSQGEAGEPNVIEKILVNGKEQEVKDKSIDISVPTPEQIVEIVKENSELLLSINDLGGLSVTIKEEGQYV